MNAYAALEARFARLADIEGALALLHWDQAVMMPQGGVEARAEQTATLALLAHEALLAPELGELLGAVDAAALDPWRAANLRLMRRARLRAGAVPADLVAAHARVTSRCEMVWRQARAQSDAALLRPLLDEVFRLTRAKAEALGDAQGIAPLDALLDQWEPGLRRADVDRLFAPLAARLPGLLDDALARQAREPLPQAPRGPFPHEAQRRLARELMAACGFDFERGRLDESAHPFCGGVPDDVRITTRYQDGAFASALMAVLHETGHALYSQSLPKAWRRQPVGKALGMVVHESQSLLLEMQASRSPAFLRWLGPKLAATFAPDPAFAAANLARLYTRVSRGLIRVDADEITYPLHIVLRYRLETALIAGDLATADLPAAWNAAMRDLLGITPPGDREGFLQDIHWPVGAIGYFPCYTLGAMLAAQLYDAARAAMPDLDAHLAAGHVAPLVAWLHEHVHQHGARETWDELATRATGRALEARPFLAHLERRYAS